TRQHQTPEFTQIPVITQNGSETRGRLNVHGDRLPVMLYSERGAGFDRGREAGAGGTDWFRVRTLAGSSSSTMLQLRVYGEPGLLSAVAERLENLPGARHVSLASAATASESVVTADVRSDAADAALTTLDDLGVPGDDIALLRLDTIARERGTAEASALV